MYGSGQPYAYDRIFGDFPAYFYMANPTHSGTYSGQIYLWFWPTLHIMVHTLFTYLAASIAVPIYACNKQ